VTHPHGIIRPGKKSTNAEISRKCREIEKKWDGKDVTDQRSHERKGEENRMGSNPRSPLINADPRHTMQ